MRGGKGMAEQLYDLTNVPIFAVGTWNQDTYSESDLDAMVSAYSQVGWQPPLKLGHDPAQKFADGMPALGWVGNLRRVGAQLVADFKQMPRKVWDAVKRKAYNRVSAEVYWDYADGGKKFPRVLKAVALLGADIPAVTNLGTLEGLYDQNGKPFKMYDFGIGMDSGGTMPPMLMPSCPKKAKVDVGYRPADPKSTYENCGACKFFCDGPSMDESDDIGSCSIVDGEVAESFTCDLQETRDAYKTASKAAKVKAHAFPPAIDPNAPDPNNPDNKNVDAALTVQTDATGQFCVFKGDQSVQCFPTQEEADALMAQMQTDPNGAGEPDPGVDDTSAGGADGQDAALPLDNVSLQDRLVLAGDAVKAVAGVLDALNTGLGKSAPGAAKPAGPDGSGSAAKKDAGSTPDPKTAPNPNPPAVKKPPFGGAPVAKKPAFPGAKPFAEQHRSYHIVRDGRKFVLKSKTTGKTLGAHDTYEQAMAQELAVQASKNASRKFEMTADQMEPLCKSCADGMRKANVRAYKFWFGPVKIYGVEKNVPLGKVRYFAVGPNADALGEHVRSDAGLLAKIEEFVTPQLGATDAGGFCAELCRHYTGKYPEEKNPKTEKAPSAKAVTRYAVEQRPSGLWDLCRETGSRVATYATEQEANDARGRLEARRPFEYAGAFDESEHPRDKDGKFSPDGGGDAGSAALEAKKGSTAKTDEYAWGKLTTVDRGNSYRAVLHPEHRSAIAKLPEGGSHVFKDEQGVTWKATRSGETIHLQGQGRGSEHKSLGFDRKHIVD